MEEAVLILNLGESKNCAWKAKVVLLRTQLPQKKTEGNNADNHTLFRYHAWTKLDFVDLAERPLQSTSPADQAKVFRLTAQN